MDETKRKLTDAEEKRLETFQKLVGDLERDGWTRTDLTRSGSKANTLGTFYGFLTALPFIILYILRYSAYSSWRIDSILWLVAYMVLFFVLIILHELIHGLTWSRFAKSGFRSISFGVIWKSLNPYCSCNEPLSRIHYMTGSLMPWFLLGVVPCIFGVILKNGMLMMMGIIMILSAGGDLLIVKMILTHKTRSEALYLDHPTEIGLVCMEKNQGA